MKILHTASLTNFFKRLTFIIICCLSLIACEERMTSSIVEPERLHFESVFAINGNGTVTLGWTPLDIALAKVSDGGHDSSFDGPGTPVEILIYRSDEKDFPAYNGTLYKSLPPGATQFIDSGLTNEGMYYYRVVPVGEFPGEIRRLGEASNVITGRPYDYSTITHINYAEHIQPIFTSSCAVSGCHVGSSDIHIGHFSKPAHEGSTQFSLKSWEDIMRGGDHGAVVIPFKSTKSHLVFHINTDSLIAPVTTPHMPLPGFNLPESQFQTIFRWINEGAYNEAGAVAFSTYPRGKVLVTNQAEDLVSVIDIATGLVSRYIQAGAPNVFAQPPQAPHNVTVDKSRGVYYVNLVSAGKVIKYNLSTNEKIGELSGIASPTQIALSKSGDTAFVAQFAPGRNAIRLFNTNTMTLLDSISSLNFERPHGVQVTPDGKELWVTGNSTDNIMVVDLQDYSTSLIQLNNQPPGAGFELLPYQTTMTSDNKYVYVSCQKSNEVLVVDRTTKEVTKRITVGQWPLILDITPDNQFVYVANRNSNDVSVIRTSDNTVTATISNVGPQPHGIDITADGQYAYVSCENVISLIPPHHPTSGSKDPGFVTIIRLNTNTIIKQIEVGAFAAGVAVVE